MFHNNGQGIAQTSLPLATVPIKASSPSTLRSHLKDGIIDLTSGSLGGIAIVYVGQPLDTVKVKMQLYPTQHTGFISCLRETFKHNGLRGLYAGAIPAMTANVLETATLFTAYGYCKKAVAHFTGTPDVSQMSAGKLALSGSLAACFSSMVLCSTELIKCRLQAQQCEMTGKPIKTTPLIVCRQILKNEGIRAFTTGIVPTLVREVPGCSFYFGGYESARYLFADKGQSKSEIGFVKTAISGAFGGLSYWIMIFPADVVKSRMQGQGGTAKQIISNVLRTNGISGFYKGLFPVLIRACIANAFLLTAYEYTKKLLHSNL